MSYFFQGKMNKERKIMEHLKMERYILNSNMRTSKLTCALSLSLSLSHPVLLSSSNGYGFTNLQYILIQTYYNRKCL